MTTELAYNAAKALHIINAQYPINENNLNELQSIYDDLPMQSNGYTKHSDLMKYIEKLKEVKK